MGSMGVNVKTKLDGDILTLTVDLSAEATLSKSGKSMVIASTQGNKVVVVDDKGDIMLGLNVFRAVEEGRA